MAGIGVTLSAAAPRRWRGLCFWLLLWGLPAAAEPVAVTVIIDDMGNQRDWGLAALSLPGQVTYAFLPFTPHAGELARLAHARGRQVMLHLPMASTGDKPLGPGALTLEMDETEFQEVLAGDLAAVPHVAGINNHMGSLLTRHPGAMDWLMRTLRRRRPGLFFVDSRTAPETVALDVALELGVPATRRNVFLDNERDPEAIRAQFERTVALARREGSAVAIGHPYPETVAALQRLLPTLERRGIRLLRASEMIQLQQRRNSVWQQPSSPWLRVAKNSRPSPSSICCAAPASRSSSPVSNPVR